MLCTAPTFRTAAIGCRMPTCFLAPYHAASTPTARLSLRTNDTKITTLRRRVWIPKRRIIVSSSDVSSSNNVRYASTVSSPSPTPSSQTTNTSSPQKLDWNTFFALRRTRRWYQLGSSITTSISGFVGGAQILTRSDMDAIVAQIPLDPFITLGLITFTCGGVGWLLGPVVGTAVFNMTKLGGGRRKLMDEKEKEFYRRIKRWRVDPSASSMANPVPGTLIKVYSYTLV